MVASIKQDKVPWGFLEWGRGTGKTTWLGDRIRRIVFGMPRSNNLLIGPTYQAILTKILPSLIQGLEMQGLYLDLHYFIGRRPPKSWKWDYAYQPPQKFNRYIQFFNGTGFHLISHDVPGDGRGLNADSETADESALLKKQNLDENTTPTLRGSNKRAFQSSPLFLSRWHASSTPLTPSGRWFTEMEDLAIQQPDKAFFLSADSSMNAHNLGDGFLENARLVTAPWVYEAEYLNIRPRQVKNGFYPLLDQDRHTYTSEDNGYYFKLGQIADSRGDSDLIKGKPLIVGVDWGAAINCMVVCQDLPGEFRALKDLYVLGENKEVQSDLFIKFNNYYQHHKATNNTIHLWYDNSGNASTGITKQTRAQLAAEQLAKLGWNVQRKTLGGSNPQHYKKHLLWTAIHRENESDRLPVFRMNINNCRDTWVSMFNAQAKMSSRDEIQKDKSSERSKSIKRQHATDLSDAIDTIVFGRFHSLLNKVAYLPETSIR